MVCDFALEEGLDGKTDFLKLKMVFLKPIGADEFVKKGFAEEVARDFFPARPALPLPSFSGSPGIMVKACSPRADRLLRIKKCSVSYQGVIRSGDYFLAENNSRDTHDIAKSAGASFSVKRTIFGGYRLRESKNIAHIRSGLYMVAHPNYAAWIMGELPRLRHYLQYIASGGRVILHGEPKKFHLEAFRLFGVSEDRITCVSEDTEIAVDELLFSTPSYSYHVPSPAGVGFLGALPEFAMLDERWRDKMIYLSRNKQTLRRILNEHEIEEALISRGYQVVAPESMTLGDQVSIFAQARIIVTPFGGTLANLCFRPKGRGPVCLIRTKFTNEFARLASMNGSELYVFDNLKRVKRWKLAPWRPKEFSQEFLVDVESLVVYLEGIAGKVPTGDLFRGHSS